ncbi:MAG: pyrroline-5-carboxylate reductase [Leptospiraceae bacterium]|nr:pyrroline-5-carboxylate reductase [Leptospiraceae bacterium]MCK6382470.1 pyrroline-5-carboxylate reductase [Leptospiraceae bacterium]NUM40935.1 pyrroline-5-carboxylate reductase [Leptospiraceae bacterium]
MEKVGVIGLGNMGSAIFHSIKNDFKTSVYDPFQNIQGVSQEENISTLSNKSDIIIVSVKPDKVFEVLKEIQSPKILISIAAGVTISDLQKNSYPESQIVRAMPNLPLTVKEGCIAYFGNKEAYPIVQKIFQNSGIVMELGSEKNLDAFTGLAGSGPAFVFTFIQSLAEGGVKSGLTYSDSLKAAIQTVKGSVKLLENEIDKFPQTHPYTLRNKVTSPGGTTIYGLDSLEKGNFSHSIISAVYKAYKRAVEIGKK